ncbi:MAG: diguanylate cyclase [Proteobacteria bacterium]|nr:diguanylate cyclase [Pseudomonadota bacterium]
MVCYVVDRDPVIRRLIISVAKSTADTEVVEFASAESLMAALPQTIAAGDELPALIVAEMALPGMDGVALCAWLKMQPAVAEVPLIMLSEDGSEEALARAFSAGAHDFAVKPFASHALLTRLRVSLRMSAAMNAQRIAERRINTELQLNRAMINSLSNMGEGLMVIEKQQFTFVNEALCRMSGFEAEELAEWPNFLQLFHPDERDRIIVNHRRRIIGATFESHYRTALLCKNGERLDIEFAVAMLTTPTHNGVVCLVRDIRKQMELEQRLRYLAEYDALTGLPNRLLLQDRLQQALRRSARTGRAIALLFIDLDGFKQINDTLGHAAGDDLLRQVSSKLSEGLRASDTAGRLAGDEFIILLEDFQNGGPDPSAVAARLLGNLANAYCLPGGEAKISASIGIAFGHGDCDTPELLLQAADSAMYKAKQAGKNTYVLLRAEDGDAVQA